MQSHSASTPRTIYILSQDSSDQFSFLKKEFTKTFSALEIDIRYQTFAPHRALSDWLAGIELPAFFLIDLKSMPITFDFIYWKNFFSVLQKLDPTLPSFILATQMPTGAMAMKWIDAGCTGFIHRDFQQEKIEEALKEILERRLRQDPRDLRLCGMHQVQMSVANFDQALAAETLNVGQGGMFLRMLPNGVKVGDRIEFELHLNSSRTQSSENSVKRNPLVEIMNGHEEATFKKIQGTGRVAWVRKTANLEGPEGLGVQFTDIEGEGAQIIENFVAMKKSKVFIPLS